MENINIHDFTGRIKVFTERNGAEFYLVKNFNINFISPNDSFYEPYITCVEPFNKHIVNLRTDTIVKIEYFDSFDKDHKLYHYVENL